jgi:hypothetical protein
MAVFGGEAISELIHVESAYEYGACTTQRADRGGIVRRRGSVCADDGAGEGGKTLYVEKVLDCERNAGERARIFASGE